MLKFAPSQVDVALLYRGPCPVISFREVLAHLNETFSCLSEPFHYSGLEMDSSAKLAGSNFFILISTHSRPLPAQDFADTLNSAYTRMICKNAAECVAQHESNIVVRVSSDDPIGAQSPEIFDMKLALCRSTAQFICAQSKPLAVHWLQSSQLLRPEHFDLLAGSTELATRLFVHPSFFSSGRTVADRRVVGARGLGAEHLINWSVVFNETPMSLEWIYERLCDFVDLIRFREGEMIPDGDSFGASETEIIVVSHEEASDGRTAGVIYLTLESREEVALHPEPQPGPGRRTIKYYKH